MKRIISLLILSALLLTAMTVTASAASGFSDVSERSWYEKAVIWATEKGITTGVGEGKFGPNQSVTRGQVVTMLWRMEGSPKASGSGGFSDVKSGAWYAKAVVWAAKNSLVNGYPNGAFVPNRKISRQELVTILYRYAEYRGKSVAAPGTDFSGFTDADSISAYALEPMRWAVGTGSSSAPRQPRSAPPAPQRGHSLCRCSTAGSATTPEAGICPSSPRTEKRQKY